MKNNKFADSIILMTLITVICLSWWSIVDRWLDVEKMEARPIWNLDSYRTYADEYEKYFSENIPFKSCLLSLNSKIDFFLFDRSPSKNVIKGKDGWYFYADTLDDYKKNNLYFNEKLELIKNNALETRQWLKEQGVEEFIIFIGPNKASVYGDYMPDYIETSDGSSRTEQVVNYLRENTDLTVIYPKQELLRARKQYPEVRLYFKLDTHWNYMGGYFGVQPLLRELGVEMAPFENITYQPVNEPIFSWNGYDLSNMMSLQDVLNEDLNYHLSGYSGNVVTYEGNIANDVNVFYGESRTYSTSLDDRKIFLIRDSFGASLIPYLAAEFNEMFSVSQAVSRTQVIEEKPDIVIFEMVERSGYSEMYYQNWQE